jgi:ubiquinone/menaquinone biosynthesis C-methylase UbiE
MYDVAGRERKAKTMVAVLEDFLNLPINNCRLLNVGGSSGIIDNYLACHFGSVIGVDIDEPAVVHARNNYSKSNLEFHVGDALNLSFPDNTFEVVICSQVYEHVPDAQKMMDEIFRVLVPGGVCYFAASNRLMWNEPHYNLPLLSVVPRPLAHVYVRLAGRARYYYELHYSYWGLCKLTNMFVVHDYTPKMISDPQKFSIEYMVAPGSVKALIAGIISKHLRWFSPSYIWLLEKPIKD